ncbi:mediator of RNA polymerase II transcription subunit 30 [Sitophilus oryzae]|uniref:Mediator of RNA polymerase II transcription subunit 30 n=1 Tax=Sitophilus oryzae TaxID=7048 RepID=A0A6J2YFZ0_SITOR|nr:mediator of RNA polymerase II transcription subunit 30 [Sitophilus oryzae]
MAAPPHHFMQNLNNSSQGALRNCFDPGSLQNTLGAGTMQNQMAGQMPQLGTAMMGQMNNPMNGPMTSITAPMNGPIQNPLTPNIQNAIPNQMGGAELGAPMVVQMNNPMNGAMSPINTQMNEFNPSLNHHEMPQSQASGVTPTPPSAHIPQQQQQSKEFNTASLCRLGQETVQDIVSRTQEVFQTLKTIQPPAGTSQSSTASNEKKAKVQELLRTIRVLFKRLRLIYEKCNENCQIQGMEYTHIESLIPFKDELDPKHEEKKNSEAYRSACEESKEVMEQVVLKNKQLKEIIDHLRRIVWEINTMLTMRKS